MGKQYVRNNISGATSGDFGDENVQWYAVGVYTMMQRALNDTASWWFFAAIHGEALLNTDPRYRSWFQVNPPPSVPTTPLPSPGVSSLYWDQCQHGTWYFPPWHRGYLMALEAQLRQDIVNNGGPANWALPYWNYFKNSQMPADFAVKTLPAKLPNGQPFPAGLGGKPNPLYVADRFGPDGDGNIYVQIPPASQDSMNDGTYTGTASGVPPGFGGGVTTFSHFGSQTGGLENNPHNLVHVMVGGSKDNSPSGKAEGLMSDPDLAALDPIFYIHHCMIDYMWASWNVDLGHSNPTDSNWVNGPTPEFVMPWPQTGPWYFTPGMVSNIQQLNYTYDALGAGAASIPAAPQAEADALGARLTHLGVAKPAPKAAGLPPAPTQPRSAELLGASAGNHPVTNAVAPLTVNLDSGVRRKVSASLAHASLATPPDRVFLKLEGVHGTHGATVLDVYVNVPAGAKPGDHPKLKAGSVGLFGLRQASTKDSKHGGGGLSFSLEITKLVDELHLSNGFDIGSLSVSLVPYRPLPSDSDITVGRVSIYRLSH